jgi:hypothetical protein
MDKKKVIIWGHKFGSDTYSYVQNAYYRAAQCIGYETHWFDDNDDVSTFDFSNSIFITEHRVRNNMPVLKDCIYFDHFSDQPFENENRPDHPNYYSFAFFADNWNWPPEEELVDLGTKHFFHKKTNTIITIWGTDLLPAEIDALEPKLHDENLQYVYFVGTSHGENNSNFERICNANGKYFARAGGWLGIDQNVPLTTEQNVEIVRNSYISFDIRDTAHLYVHKRYYPCRLFKNISYGKWTGSNVPAIADVFGEHYTTDSDLETLYHKLVEDSRNCTYEKMRSAMDFVRDHHTYVSRIKSMFSILD